VFWHSLEHLPNAGAELDRAASLLASGGVLVIAVPNNASMQARVLGDQWLALDLPRHLVHLSSALLTERLRARSLRVERVSYWRGGHVALGWLHGMVAKLPGHPDLYDAIRRPEARRQQRSAWPRPLALAPGALLVPAAVVAAAVEVLASREGTVYVEARRG
jgi:hypothetical protein